MKIDIINLTTDHQWKICKEFYTWAEEYFNGKYPLFTDCRINCGENPKSIQIFFNMQVPINNNSLWQLMEADIKSPENMGISSQMNMLIDHINAALDKNSPKIKLYEGD